MSVSPPPLPKFPPGLVGEIATFIFSAAPRPVEKIALAGALGAMAGICGRAYNVSGTGLNQYILLLAPTGTGKEAMASGIARLFGMIRSAVPSIQNFIGPSVISSMPALVKHLSRVSPCFVSLVGEFGLTLRQICAPNANATQIGLRRILLDLYNKSGHGQVLQQIIYSDRANNTDSIASPSFSLLGESTPESFYDTLDESLISEGLLPRFTIIEYYGPRPELSLNHANARPPDSTLKQLVELVTNVQTLMYAGRVIEVQCNEAAAQLFANFDRYCDAQINSASKEIVRHLWNRAHIKSLKLASLVAVGCNFHHPIITYDDAWRACDLVARDVNGLMKKFEAGDVGKDNIESRQLTSLVSAITHYTTSEFIEVAGYGVPIHLHKDHVVPLSYLHRKLAKTAPFRTDRQGPTEALKRTLRSLVDQATIVEFNPIQRSELFKTSGRVFMLSDMWELRKKI